MLKVTSFSQLINIIIFILFSLLTQYPITPLLQLGLILISYYILKIHLRAIKFKEVLPILPILLFVFIINCFRGNGEIAFRFGPFALVKQGIYKGYYYSFVIGILFFMSKILTKAFDYNENISVLYSIDRVIISRMPFIKSEGSFHNRKLLIVVYYILRIFENTYSELRIFFDESKFSLKQKLILFIYSVFKLSENNYLEMDGLEISTIKPITGDFLYISFQLSMCILIFIFNRVTI